MRERERGIEGIRKKERERGRDLRNEREKDTYIYIYKK